MCYYSETKRVMTCNAKSCQQTCLAGGCTLKCLGESCKQICQKGNCKLKCPKTAEKCVQNCGQFNDCEKEYLQPPKALRTQTRSPTTKAPRTECDSVGNGVCIQSCVGGGCSLKCLNSVKYHSCQQFCTGKFQNVF